MKLLAVSCLITLIILPLQAQKIDLERGLIAYYPFNEGPKDKSSNNNHGTNRGATHAPGIRCGDGAYEFDGKASYIDFGSSPIYKNTMRGLTVSFMFNYKADTDADFQTLVGKWAFNKKIDQFAAFISAQKKLSWAVADGLEYGHGLYSDKTFEPNRWYHVVLVWNRSRKMGIFVDGKLDKMGEQHGNGYNTESDISLKVGRQVMGQNRPFGGYIDEVRIYNRSLSFAEIEALFIKDNMVCNQFTLVGTVFNKNTGEPLGANIIFEDQNSGNEYVNINSDSVTGDYEIKLPIGYNFDFYAKAPKFFSINQSVSTEAVQPNTVVEKDLFLVPIEIGGTVILNNIFFEYNKATLLEESFPELKKLVRLFREIPGLQVEIAGHTDSRGSDSYNLTLSDARANSVMKYLVENGVDPEKITAKGYGEAVPVATNDTDEGRQQNRRVEFKILAMD